MINKWSFEVVMHNCIEIKCDDNKVAQIQYDFLDISDVDIQNAKFIVDACNKVLGWTAK